jgi:hypothetical protein
MTGEIRIGKKGNRKGCTSRLVSANVKAVADGIVCMLE